MDSNSPLFPLQTINSNVRNAKPFVKWAGGKTQLLPIIKRSLPLKWLQSKDATYIEPFVGSGAVLFWMLGNVPQLKKAVINDINADLINTYQIIADKPHELISILRELEREFHELDTNSSKKKEFFNKHRVLYNSRKETLIYQAALFIFLNRTCFNGLYRVNRNNEFNVPMGAYHKPLICNEENILSVSVALQKVEIVCGDYQTTLDHVTPQSLFYLDPPYKPLTASSRFTAYAKDEFNDEDQIRLRDFCTKLDLFGHYWIMSNSDPRNIDEHDNFFDDLYKRFHVMRVEARRNINSKAEKRGFINELLITNQDFHLQYANKTI